MSCWKFDNYCCFSALIADQGRGIEIYGHKRFFAKASRKMKNFFAYFSLGKTIKKYRKNDSFISKVYTFYQRQTQQKQRGDLTHVSRFPISAFGTDKKKGSPR